MTSIFHCTSRSNLDSIVQNGLRLGTEWMGRPRSVYFVKTLEDAMVTTEKFVWGNERVMLEFDVPQEVIDMAIEDEYHNEDFGTSTASRVEMPIGAQYLKAATVFNYHYNRQPGERLEEVIKYEFNQDVEEAMCSMPCKQCENEPRMLLTKRATGELYFWVYCSDCEAARKAK